MLLLIAKAFFLGLVVFSYPVIAFPLRDGLDKLIFKKQPAPFLRSFAEAGVIGRYYNNFISGTRDLSQTVN